jgi:CRISPR-associated RAMP protein (TIGR02581 family)
MLKKNLSEMIIQFDIIPTGPILVKSGIEGGADPTIPDMNFVRTIHPDTGDNTVYLPGSSLKGVFRSYAEKIANTVGLKIEDVVAKPDSYEYLKKKPDNEIYKGSDCIAKLFGSQILASRIKFKDAFPKDGVEIEHRTNVSISRTLGSVQAGPFNMEVVTKGKFKAKISVRNFELWQIGLLGLVLRDLSNGQIKIGYAKTRGLGDVKIALDQIEIDITYSKPNYDTKALNNIDGKQMGEVLGLDRLLKEKEADYGVKRFDDLNITVETKDEDGWGTNLNQKIRGNDVVKLLRKCVEKHWAKYVEEELKSATDRIHN